MIRSHGKGGLDDTILTYDENGNVIHHYLHGPAVDQIFSDESAVDGLLWALADRQGSVKDWADYDEATDATSVYNHVEYDSFGAVISQSNAAHEITVGYTGRYVDVTTGDQLHGVRWYNPEIGRWHSVDPGGFAMGDVSLFRYVFNSPTNYTDPSGLAGWVADGGMQGSHGFVPRFVPFDPPAPWREPYDNNPEAQKDFDELRKFVAGASDEVPWIDPCYVWANNLEIPRRFTPTYDGKDKSRVTVEPVYWLISNWGIDGDHAAFKATFPDGSACYFDEGGGWSTTAGALGGPNRWFGEDEIPSNYVNEGPHPLRPHSR